MAKKTPPSDDFDLWAKVTKTVTPANREDVLFADTTKKAPLKSPGSQKKQNSQKQVAPPKIAPIIKTSVKPADLRFAEPQKRAGIDNASARRLTKGHFAIDEMIDLHGKTEAMAHKALVQFVLSASRNGARTLLVITGKGAKGQGVLRQKVPDWLQEPPLKSHVLAISQASPKDGGGGAYYVRLRRMR